MLGTNQGFLIWGTYRYIGQDENGIPLDPKPPKVISARGEKRFAIDSDMVKLMGGLLLRDQALETILKKSLDLAINDGKLN